MLHCMDPTTASLASHIGGRIRRERQSRRWTLDQLATAAGVSRRMVVMIEQGTTNPSVGTLLRLSDALGVGLPSLVAPPQPDPVSVTRHGEGAALWTSEAGGRAVLVTGTGPPDVVELWDWHLAPEDHYDSEAHAAGTKELLQVHEGRVELDVAGQVVTLHAGDAVTFSGEAAHSYSNLGTTPARFSLAVFEPGVGSGALRGAPVADAGSPRRSTSGTDL